MKQFTFLFIVGWCVANILATCVVQTPLGLIKGSKLKSSSGREFDAYRGIPYAEPPIGKLRFGSPVPRKPWNHILDADRDRCQCPQLNNGVVRGCEDCLHLNIYTPKRNPRTLLPVLVYFHSSYYINLNDSRSFAGPDYILNEDVVYVATNYRLGSLGFLSTGDGAAPGNYGLKDQQLALKWIKEHIHIFGGNPNDVTLFGEGSGSESVNLHLLSPGSKGLFKKGILQSGNIFGSGVIASGPSYHEKGKKVAELLKCPTKDSHKMIDCLRKVNHTDLVKVSLQVFDELEIAMKRTWRPTKEPKGPGAFITGTATELIQSNQWAHVPVIIGAVKDEGTSFTESLVKNTKVYEHCSKDPVGVIKRFLEYYPPLEGLNLTDIAVKAKDHYIGKKVPKSKEVLIEKFTDLVTDFHIFTTLQCNKYLRQIEPERSFCYLFDYISTITSALIFKGNERETYVGHGSDIFSIFPTSGAYIDHKFASLKRSKKDYEIIAILIDLWTSFATNSVPISNKLKNSHLWQPQRNSTNHLKIGNGKSTEVTVEVKYSERHNFWVLNVPQYCTD